MNRLIKSLAVFSFILILSAGDSRAAGTPNLLTYQGILMDSLGQTVEDGLYLIRFQIYDDSVSGALIWTSASRELNVVDGQFSYKLGDSVPLPQHLFATDSALWLGVKIGTDPEISPRTRLTSYAYSRHSLSSDSSEIAATVYDNSITGAKIVDASITGADIATSTITGAHIQDETISSADIVDGSVTGADIAVSTVTGVNIQDGAIGSADIADGSITGSDIAGGTIGSGNIQNGAIGNAQLEAGSVNSNTIVDNSIATEDLAAGAVTGSKLATNSVSSTNIVDGTIFGQDIGLSSIGSQHVVNASLGIIDMSAGAIASAGWTELATASTNSTSPVTLDSVEVLAPGPGTLIIQLSGQVYLDADAVSTTSVTAYAELGICDSLNSSGYCDGTYDPFFSQDADNISSNNVTKYVNIQRLVFVSAAGPRKFYINGAVGNSSTFLWLYTGPKVVAIFLPAAMGVSSSPAIPNTIDLSQQK